MFLKTNLFVLPFGEEPKFNETETRAEQFFAQTYGVTFLSETPNPVCERGPAKRAAKRPFGRHDTPFIL